MDNKDRRFISIHAPHAGRDFVLCIFAQPVQISIHAPHAGRDYDAPRQSLRRRNFNPRAPCGARLPLEKHRLLFCLFQSTRPMRGATQGGKNNDEEYDISIHAPHAGRDGHNVVLDHDAHISIHAPHAGRDPALVDVHFRILHFNPRAPCGARPREDAEKASEAIFQSTRPMRGAT